MRRVVITGLGIVSCLGNNQEEVHQSLLNSKSGISYSGDWRSPMYYWWVDPKKELIVVYSGAVPNLFSEERGAVVEGKLNDKKYLIADRILAKHDENYMPPQMKKILKENKKKEINTYVKFNL